MNLPLGPDRTSTGEDQADYSVEEMHQDISSKILFIGDQISSIENRLQSVLYPKEIDGSPNCAAMSVSPVPMVAILQEQSRLLVDLQAKLGSIHNRLHIS